MTQHLPTHATDGLTAGPRRDTRLPRRHAASKMTALILLVALTAGIIAVSAGDAAAATRPHTPARIGAHLYGPRMRAVLTWSRTPGASVYRVFRSGHLLARHVVRRRFVDRTVRMKRAYRYFVRACNPYGCSRRTTRVRVRTPWHAPRSPVGVRAARSGPHQVSIAWERRPAARKYRLFRNGRLFAHHLLTTRFRDSSAPRGVPYEYSVKACNPGGCSRRSQTVVVAGTAPAPPTGVKAVPENATQVAVSWRADSMASTYRLIRNRSIVAQDVPTTSHVDSPVAPATTYTYAVKSCNESGCSTPSGPVTVTTPSGKGGAPATPSGFTAGASDATHVALDWKSTWKAISYRVYRNGNLLATVSAISFVDDTVAPQSTHSYAVAACASECSAPTSQISVTTPSQPAPDPSGVTAGVTGPGEVTVSWDALTGATSYRLYRNGVPIATTTTPGYVDTGLAPSTLYFYMVRACSSTGCSLPSDAVVVETPGSPPGCSGVNVTPGSDLVAIVKSYSGGTTFCLASGTYAVTGMGILLKNHDTVIGEPGTVLDGGGVATYGLYGYGTSTGQHDVTVEGLILRNFAGRAIRAGWNWTIEGNEMSSSQVGVALNSGVVLRGNYIHDNRQYGISSGPASNILIEGNELSHNNTSLSCGGSCAGNAGGSKIVGSTPGTYGVTWRGNWVHDNFGPGIWSDGNVHNVLYENNLVQDNTGIGIFHEISWAGTIRDNVVRYNATKRIGKSCWWGAAQIVVNNSQNVQVYGNTASSSAGANGICGYGGVRSETSPFPTSLANLSVHDNIVHVVGTGMSGEAGENASNISFDSDVYYVDNLSTDHWTWRSSGPETWSEFRGIPQETHGTLKPDH